MGKNSSIEWTHHTFNPWWGCAKVSLACNNCYAEKWSKRLGSDLWGPEANRRFFGENHWREPIRWNKEAEKKQERKRVFCASMADVFEDRKDLDESRNKLWKLIETTPWLDWCILTKRTENINKMIPWDSNWPRNVWMGTTIESQELAEKRIPELIKIPAKIRFISCEPLLSLLNISNWLCEKPTNKIKLNNCIDWVIAGGESGAKSRPTHPVWIKKLRDQCIKTNTPFHFKQWGNWCPLIGSVNGKRRTIEVNSGTDEIVTMVRKNKKDAGRELEGMNWDGLP
jgi:protein gp37